MTKGPAGWRGLSLSLYCFQFPHPQCIHRVGGHPPVSPGREGQGAHLGAVGEAGALELLGEEAAVEVFQPFEDEGIGNIVRTAKGPANRRGLLSSKQLTRSTAERLSQLAGVDNRHFFGQDILLQLRQHVQREAAFFCQCLQALAPLFP